MFFPSTKTPPVSVGKLQVGMGNRHKLVLAKCLLVLISYDAMVLAKPSYHPQPQDFPNERLYRTYLVIQHFKKTITSDPKNITDTWTGRDICGRTTYLGFYCTALPGRRKELTVTEVFLNGFGLHAPKLQGFIDRLPDLAFFHAASNNFGGDIPRLDGLDYMYKLNVDNDMRYRHSAYNQGDLQFVVDGKGRNCFTAFLNFTFHARTPDLNKWRGIIPHGATDSKTLLLNYNNLSGKLPADLGFSKLSYLALAHNRLTGPIPTSIEQLQDSLLEVLLLNNQLSGCLPHELGMLHKASVIDVGMNQITGPIPSSFSCLNSVEQLNLGGNRLYGQVPDALCKLAGPAGCLANLTLSSNYFTSVGPACAALIKDGVLDVKNNCIPGLANQRRPAECAAFQNQPKTCPAASTQVACPTAAAMGAVAAPGERKTREYSSYVTYATLHA